MRVAVFSTKPYDREFLDEANKIRGHELVYIDSRLTLQTALAAREATAVCAFVNDQVDAQVLQVLAEQGTRLVALRCAGFNNVDLVAARDLGIAVGRVPEYSPYAVAEHTVALILSLNRKIHRAYARVREGNFSLSGLLGFDLKGRTIGIIGTGKIGTAFARIMAGFGCRLVASDPMPNAECEGLGVDYCSTQDLFGRADIVSLHCPLTPQTHHLIDADAVSKMREGVMLINTSRGAVIDTSAAIKGLKSGRIGSLGLDVYEEEADLFFENLSDRVIQDDVFARLLSFSNVLITGHQAFFTVDAMQGIANTTIENISSFEQKGKARHAISIEKLA
jgi:D-lactate dehydrogenase